MEGKRAIWFIPYVSGMTAYSVALQFADEYWDKPREIIRESGTGLSMQFRVENGTHLYECVYLEKGELFPGPSFEVYILE